MQLRLKLDYERTSRYQCLKGGDAGQNDWVVAVHGQIHGLPRIQQLTRSPYYQPLPSHFRRVPSILLPRQIVLLLRLSGRVTVSF